MFISTVKNILRACCSLWDNSDSDSDSEPADIETGQYINGTKLPCNLINTKSLNYLQEQIANHQLECEITGSDENVKLLWADIYKTINYSIYHIYNNVCIHNKTKVTAQQVANTLPELHNKHILSLLDTYAIFPDMYNIIYIRHLIQSFESRKAVNDYGFRRTSLY